MKNFKLGILGLAVALTSPASASGPQEDLYRYLAQKAAATVGCSQFPASNRYCHPARVNVSPSDAHAALTFMRAVDALMLPCRADDAQSCYLQARDAGALQKMGWCTKSGLDADGVQVVGWARC